MAEQAPGVGDQMREILSPARSEQVDIESRKMALKDAELRVHHPEQAAHLRWRSIDAPADRHRRSAAEDQHDQSESPGARQRHDPSETARAGVEQHGEQDAGEQQQQACRVVPGKRQHRDDSKYCQRQSLRRSKHAGLDRTA